MTLDTGVRSVFSDTTLFTTLATSAYADSGLSALSRSFRTVLDPTGFDGGVTGETRTIIGYSADTPALLARPLDIGLSNFLLLSERVTGTTDGYDRSDNTLAQQAYDYLNDNGLIDSLPYVGNNAGSVLTNAAFELFLSEQANSFVSSAISGPEAEPDPLVVDFSNRPTEYTLFDTTYDSVASDSSLNSQFYRRIGLATSSSVNLGDLRLTSSAGNATHYAIRLLDEVGNDGSGTITDNFGVELSNDTVISYADLANYTYTSAGNKNTDYLSFIELEDSNTDGIYEGRGELQTLAITASEERADALDGEESILRYNFYAESGTSTKRLTLLVSGLDGLGYTDALDAINQGDLRIQASETLPDGEVNMAITDLYVSDANDIVVQFAYQQAEDGLRINGIDVELRGLDTSLSLRTVDVTAIFA